MLISVTKMFLIVSRLISIYLSSQLYVATAPELQGVSGKYFHPVAKQGTPIALSGDLDLQRRLWEESERITRAFQASTSI